MRPEPIVRSYSKGDPACCRDAPWLAAFAAIDPGSKGMLAAWPRGVGSHWPSPPTRVRPLGSGFQGLEGAAAACVELGVEVLVVEHPYASKSPQSTLSLARAWGTSVGYVAGALQRAIESPVWIVDVAPQTWQSAVLTLPHPAKREHRKAAALKHALPALGTDISARRAAEQEALADCFGIADWYRRILLGPGRGRKVG